jgi:hypothetical protein
MYVFKESGEDDGDTIDGTTDKVAQTFTVLDDCTISGAVIRAKYNTGIPTGGTGLTVELMAVDSNHQPSGSALASGEIAWGDFGVSYANESVTFGSSYDLVAGTEYALVFSAPSLATNGVDFGGLEAPTSTPTYSTAGTEATKLGYAWFDNAGAGWAESTTTETNLFYPTLTIDEGNCVFVINAWGTTWPSGNSGDKYIIWSGTSTPIDNTYVDVNFYTATSMQVTVRYINLEERYWVLDGYDLIADINSDSVIVEAVAPDTSDQRDEYPIITPGGWQYFGLGAGDAGANGATDVASTDYETGLGVLANVGAHVITVAGRKDQATISKLVIHVNNATDQKRERIGVAGHGVGLDFADVLTSNGAYNEKRLVWVTPGVLRTNPSDGNQETLPASYMAAYVAGWLAANDPSESILYKSLSVEGLETDYTENEVDQIVQRRMICASTLTEGGTVWRESINTTIQTADREITVVRIVDYARMGLRSICNGFIGKKNLSSQRAAIQTVVESHLENMKNATMLVDSDDAYSVEISAPDAFTVQVVVTIRPVGTIKYIDLKFIIRGQ